MQHRQSKSRRNGKSAPVLDPTIVVESACCTDASPVACYTLRAMFVDLHPATFRLRGDDGYNPRDLCSQAFSDGTELLSGVYRDDGVHPLRDAAARPNRPFAFWLPPNADFTRINNKIFYRLQTG